MKILVLSSERKTQFFQSKSLNSYSSGFDFMQDPPE